MGVSLGAERETVVPALNNCGGVLPTRAIAWLSQRRGREGSGWQNMGGWSALAIGLALLVSVPIFVVFAYVFVPAGDVWRHLADTVLGAYVVNTLWLLFGVGRGVFVIGVGTAWLVTMCRFPGRTLGMGSVATVGRVHAPIITPSLMTAALLVFVDVMKELPATLILRPFDFNTLAVYAFELASDEQLREAAAPALTIVFTTLAVSVLGDWLRDRLDPTLR